MRDDPREDESGDGTQAGRQEGVQDDDRGPVLEGQVRIEFSVRELNQKTVTIILGGPDQLTQI